MMYSCAKLLCIHLCASRTPSRATYPQKGTDTQTQVSRVQGSKVQHDVQKLRELPNVGRSPGGWAGGGLLIDRDASGLQVGLGAYVCLLRAFGGSESSPLWGADRGFRGV